MLFRVLRERAVSGGDLRACTEQNEHNRALYFRTGFEMHMRQGVEEDDDSDSFMLFSIPMRSQYGFQ
eukprot:9500759-Pyramimonas_sp.AAC.1